MSSQAHSSTGVKLYLRKTQCFCVISTRDPEGETDVLTVNVKHKDIWGRLIGLQKRVKTGTRDTASAGDAASARTELDELVDSFCRDHYESLRTGRPRSSEFSGLEVIPTRVFRYEPTGAVPSGGDPRGEEPGGE